MKALVVDDNEDAAMLLKIFLEPYGTCDTAKCGEDGIRAFKEGLEMHLYDLVCLDVAMPDIDGFEVLNTIRELEKRAGIKEKGRAKVFIVTANFIQKEQPVGDYDHYILKPIELEEFENILWQMKLIEHAPKGYGRCCVGV